MRESGSGRVMSHGKCDAAAKSLLPNTILLYPSNKARNILIFQSLLEYHENIPILFLADWATLVYPVRILVKP